MKHTTKHTSAIRLLAATLAFSAACGTELTTSPTASLQAPEGSASASKAAEKAPKKLKGKSWVSPVLQPITYSVDVSATRGGEINFPTLGTKIVIPAGAVSGPMRISVTALPGSVVAFDFQPAGTRFIVPLTVTQDLKKVNWTSSTAFNIVYFQNADDVDEENGTVNASEDIPTVVARNSAMFKIWHFSGYAASAGRMMDE